MGGCRLALDGEQSTRPVLSVDRCRPTAARCGNRLVAPLDRRCGPRAARRQAGRLMSWFDAFRERVTNLVMGQARDRDLDEEIAYHLELETNRQIAAGCDPVVAR